MPQYFFIKKNSELPILQMRVINDGRSDYKKVLENIENYTITFSMRNTETGRYGVFNKPALVIPMQNEACEITEYHIGYKFSKKETSIKGTYKAEFKINNQDGECVLILPVRNELFVNIADSFVNSTIIDPSLVGTCNSGSIANYLLHSDYCFIITENGDKIIL
jgi:hypothetical protein